jgi:ABC-type uncharacterized transport system YnjBCD ATPase subunit
MIHNPNRKNKARVTFEERGHMIRRLTISDAAWKALPPSEKGSQERNRRQKALKYFEMKGTLLIRRPETIAQGTDHEVVLPLCQVALDDDVYYIIKW